MDGNYSVDDATIPDFELTEYHWKKMCSGYRKQDLKKERDITHNVSAKDFEEIKEMFKDPCYICGKRFTTILHPTLDGKNNAYPHIMKNVIQCCELCNKSRSDRDVYETRLQIKIRQFAYKFNLPMIIDNAEVHDLIRNGITGGLSNVMHRVNIAGETKINKFYYETGKVISKDTDNVMTHAIGVDFNSLYPFCYGSIRTKWNPYDNGVMYMPGRLIKYESNSVEARKLLDECIATRYQNHDEDAKKGMLFVVKLRAHMPEEYRNDFINFPPVLRNT
jgi:hypothetical protein